MHLTIKERVELVLMSGADGVCYYYLNCFICFGALFMAQNVCYYYLNCFICFGALFMAHPVHQKKGTSVRITFLLLHIISTYLKSYSPPMNEGMYTSVVELSRLMSKPIQDSSFHFIVIAISVAPESFFHWTKEVVV